MNGTDLLDGLAEVVTLAEVGDMPTSDQVAVIGNVVSDARGRQALYGLATSDIANNLELICRYAVKRLHGVAKIHAYWIAVYVVDTRVTIQEHGAMHGGDYASIVIESAQSSIHNRNVSAETRLTVADRLQYVTEEV